jgi:serine/threonine protein kinase
MGEVYRARDTRLERDVAIKVMADHIASDPGMRHRFETEAKSVAALSHPNILSIYELAFFDGFPVAVMELLEGETLRSRLKKGAMGWREAVRIGGALADGLAAAHAKGVVHRDLKPENVFLTSDEGVKILDFGLALQRLHLTEGATEAGAIARTAQGVVLGTFGYMSPEQVLGERVDGRSDIFAAGCLIYEMLTGRRLFNGATPQEIIASLMHSIRSPRRNCARLCRARWSGIATGGLRPHRISRSRCVRCSAAPPPAHRADGHGHEGSPLRFCRS